MLKAIISILTNDATVRSLVGQNKAKDKYKIYPVVVPETETHPYLAARITGKNLGAKNCGHIYTIEVIAYHSSYDSVSALIEAAEDALLSEPAGTIEGISYGFSQLMNESDDFVKDHDLFVKTATFQTHGI